MFACYAFACRAHVYDDAEIQSSRIQDDVVLQQNDAYSTQVQLEQNVSYVTSSSENHQHQQYVHLLCKLYSNSSVTITEL